MCLKRNLIFAILILGTIALALVGNVGMIDSDTATMYSHDTGLFPEILDDDAAYAKYDDGAMVTDAFQVKPTGVRRLTKSEYTAIVAEQRLLYETASHAKADAYNTEYMSFSVQLRGEGSHAARLMWDKSQRVTPYLHNNSSDVAIRDSLCITYLRAEANRALSLVEYLYVRFKSGDGRWSASISHQLSYGVLPGHKAWVQFVPNIMNVFGHDHRKGTDLYIPDLSDGLYEILSTPLATSDTFHAAYEAVPCAPFMMRDTGDCSMCSGDLF